MDAIDVMLQRRSYRRYTDKPVEKEKLVSILEAAMAAPSACNNQPWEFVVVSERIEELRENLYHGNYNATAAIVVCGNLKIAKGGLERYWEQDCSAAMQNILLAATSLGLGSVWIGVHPLPSVVKPVRELLSIPDYVVPLGVALIGYSNEDKKPRTQFNEKRVYWERYDKDRKHRARSKNTKLL